MEVDVVDFVRGEGWNFEGDYVGGDEGGWDFGVAEHDGVGVGETTAGNGDRGADGAAADVEGACAAVADF